MPRRNDKGRKRYSKRLTKYRVAKLLGIRPSQLTSKGSYVTKKVGSNLSQTEGGVRK